MIIKFTYHNIAAVKSIIVQISSIWSNNRGNDEPFEPNTKIDIILIGDNYRKLLQALWGNIEPVEIALDFGVKKCLHIHSWKTWTLVTEYGSKPEVYPQPTTVGRFPTMSSTRLDTFSSCLNNSEKIRIFETLSLLLVHLYSVGMWGRQTSWTPALSMAGLGRKIMAMSFKMFLYGSSTGP